MFLGLVACFVALSVECIWSNPVMLDEFAHIPAALSHWQLGRYFLYRENPPLVRSLAAIPVLLSSPVMDYGRAEAGHRSEWDVGVDFVGANASRYHVLIGRGRCVILFLAIACAALIFWWSSESYGSVIGLACAALWLSDPTVLAHSSIATIDVGAATFCCLATYTFWRFLRNPDGTNALVAGLGLGLAECSKFSMLVLYPVWMVLTAVAHNKPDVTALNRIPTSRSKPSLGQLACLFALSILVINLSYGFDGTGMQLGRLEFRSQLLTGNGSKDSDHPITGNRFRGTWIARLPVPLPSQYLLGFDSQKWEEELGFVRLSGGRIVKRGAWYSPLETLAYKLPMGTLVLWIAVAGYWVVRSRGFRITEAVAALPAIALLIMLFTQTGLNWVVRYALPVFPLFCVASGRSIHAFWASKIGRIVVLACLAWNTVTLLGVRPNYLSFANLLAGGHVGGRRYFLGSNYDWGQDLFRLKRWYENQPDRRPLSMTYYGVLSSEALGLSTVGVPESFLDIGSGDSSVTEGQRGFYWVISANILNGMPGNVSLDNGLKFRAMVRSDRLTFDNAFARVGDTLYIFRIDADARVASPRSLTCRQLRACLKPATELDRKTYATP